MHVSNSIFFSDQKYWQTPKASDIASIYNSLATLCDLNPLKTLFALIKLMVSDFENLYVTADEIAAKSR